MRPTFIISTIPLVTTAILIQDVSKGEFEDLLERHELLLTAFSSRSYEPVQPFLNIFEQVAESIQTPSVLINCDAEEELCKKYDINSYPAVKLFTKRGGSDGAKVGITRYRGKRTKEAIRSFAIKHEVPTVTHVALEALSSFKLTDDLVVIAYLRPDQELLLSIYKNIAENNRHEFVFGHVDDLAAADAESLTMPSIVCYKNADGDNKVLSGHFTKTDLEGLLEAARINVIGEFSERKMDVYMAKDKLTVYLFTANLASSTEIRHEVTQLAKKFAKYVTFGMVDAAEYAPLAQNFGMNVEKGLPAMVVHAPMNDNIFIYQQGRRIEREVVEGMLTTILQGKGREGQIFGSEAEAMEAETWIGKHDEL